LVTEYVNPDTSSPGAVNRQFNHKLTVDMDCDDYNDDDDVIMSGDTGYPSLVGNSRLVNTSVVKVCVVCLYTCAC